MLNSHIAVLGMSFSGSTVLNYCLGSLPDCATISESHWLVDAKADELIGNCRKCGLNCKVLTTEFKQSLFGIEDYYNAIRERFGVKHLFSSDKDLKIYDQLEPGREFSAIVTFKDPLYQLNSWSKVMNRENRAPKTKQDLDNFLNYYTNYYQRIIDSSIIGEKYFLPIHTFQQKPVAMLQGVSEFFSIPFAEDAVKYWNYEHHVIGGNFDPYLRYKEKGDSAVQVQDLRPVSFVPEFVEVANAHESSRVIFERMREMM